MRNLISPPVTATSLSISPLDGNVSLERSKSLMPTGGYFFVVYKSGYITLASASRGYRAEHGGDPRRRGGPMRECGGCPAGARKTMGPRLVIAETGCVKFSNNS